MLQWKNDKIELILEQTYMVKYCQKPNAKKGKGKITRRM